MSESSIVFGRIRCRSIESIKKNIEVISRLPLSAEYSVPFFTAEMFNRNLAAGKMDHVLGFARSYKNIEHRWEEWISEFEELIAKLEWESINVILETEMFGTHQYFWLSKI
jgi:hypothetical protein